MLFEQEALEYDTGYKEPDVGLRMAELHNNADARLITDRQAADRQWLAAYTRSQHENSVARQLESKAVAFLLPQYLKCNPRFLWAICRQLAGWRT